MMKKTIVGNNDRYLTSDKEFVLQSLNKSMDRIEKAFSRYSASL